MNVRKTLVTAAAICSIFCANAQNTADSNTLSGDTAIVERLKDNSVVDGWEPIHIGDSLDASLLGKNDTLRLQKKDWSKWRPNPKRALWLALVIPGGGQIYNRKYWKLPIVYGGFVGCAYAMQWNNQMYKDYSQAYLDITDSDPATQSYNQFLHLGTQINSLNEDRYRQLFKRRKDYYRRYRDLSFFIMVGVYALSVIDAYVDASLSDFDISKDLSMTVSPTFINSNTDKNPIKSGALGLQCSLNF